MIDNPDIDDAANAPRRCDGGPAFPTEGVLTGNRGMSLRDWLAGQVSGAVIIACAHDSIPDGLTREEWFAIRSYAVADAMLEARKQ